MIFVILGTQDKKFTRLLKKIDSLIDEKVIKEEVIVQAGCTDYISNKMKIINYIDRDDFEKYISKASFIITHGGVGSILDSLRVDKKVIAIPRLSKYEEHVNDHQEQIIDVFDKKGYIIGCKDISKLGDKIKNIQDFNPEKYESNNNNFINKLSCYIINNEVK